MPGYDHGADLISESYAYGTLHGPVLRFGFYLPSGLLLFLFAMVGIAGMGARGAARVALWAVGLFYGLGTAVTALFPCDAGCDMEDPSVAQLVHMAAGAVTYLLVPPAVLSLGASVRAWPSSRWLAILAFACGVIAVVGAWILFLGPPERHAGLVQRCVESAVLFWVTYCSVYFLRQAQ